jgi:hypothetical protein
MPVIEAALRKRMVKKSALRDRLRVGAGLGSRPRDFRKVSLFELPNAFFGLPAEREFGLSFQVCSSKQNP